MSTRRSTTWIETRSDLRIVSGAVALLPFDSIVELLGLTIIILAILIKG